MISGTAVATVTSVEVEPILTWPIDAFACGDLWFSSQMWRENEAVLWPSDEIDDGMLW